MLGELQPRSGRTAHAVGRTVAGGWISLRPRFCSILRTTDGGRALCTLRADGRPNAETERDIAAATAPTRIFFAQGFSLAPRDGSQPAPQRNRLAAAPCGKIGPGRSAGRAA
jgi:hypothetical protein